LERCLRALAAAREQYPFAAYVVDSSGPELIGEVTAVCERFPFATLHSHVGVGYGAARNESARTGTAPLVITVDDDVYVTPDAVKLMVNRYCQETGWRVVAGSVSWGAEGSGPVRMRRIGYGTHAESEERGDFYATALLLYPRELVRQFPYPEGILSSEDRFMGALWRSKGVKMLWAPGARAVHDDEHSAYSIDHYEAHIYVNLFDALMVRSSLAWACCFEFLGFAAGARQFRWDVTSQRAYAVAWWRGTRRFVLDRRRLSEMVARSIVGEAPAG
jgi:GT2 family glycosyltransferase